MLADDIAAETFLRAWQALPRYEERGRPLAAWLLRIAAHVAADEARRQRRLVTGRCGTDMVVPARAPPAAAGPEVLVERREQARWLQGHLAALAPLERSALWLRYGEERPVAEIAQRLGKSPGATKQVLHRALQRVRRQLQAERQEGPGRRTETGATGGR
jgi:RNA polymerase sigma-70 factor (ECF subfamily)